MTEVMERQMLITLILQGEIEAKKKGLYSIPMTRMQAELIADYLLNNGVKVGVTNEQRAD